MVAVTQATELGTCYSLAELRALADFCRASDLRVFLDGARLANAAAYLDCSLAEIAGCADVLTFGGTKNGAMGAEALIVMRLGLAADMPYLRKQQDPADVEDAIRGGPVRRAPADDLWRTNAAHANAMARRAGRRSAGCKRGRDSSTLSANAVFARLEPGHVATLRQEWAFHVWDEEGDSVVRWMTAFDTAEADVSAFLDAIRETASA